MLSAPNGQQVPGTANICSVISALNNSRSIELKMPIFSDENEYNPLEFLDDIKKYFKIKNITTDERKLDCLDIALDGKSRSWWKLQHNIHMFSNSERSFLNEFYATPVQVKVESKWSNTKYRQRVASKHIITAS